jgi:hypothetical protein
MLTFKTNEKWLYDEIVKHSGKGNWIKDILSEKVKSPGEKAHDLGPVGPSIEDDFNILGGL